MAVTWKRIAYLDEVNAKMNLTGSNLAIGSDADGDIYYRASSVLARLAKGAAGTKLFMNAAGTAPEWAFGAKVSSFTRDCSAASGDVAYTGIGFKPSILLFLSGYSNLSMSVGISNVTVNGCSFVRTGKGNIGYAFYLQNTDGSASQTAVVKTLDSDGFTLTYTKLGSPTGTETVYFLALR